MYLDSLPLSLKCMHNFGWNPEGKIPLAKRTHVWMVNTEIVVEETWWQHVEWIHLSEDQWWTVVNMVMNEPLLSIKSEQCL
jgi:hypothetical protein